MAERLRRKIRNLLGFSRAGSSPAGVVNFFIFDAVVFFLQFLGILSFRGFQQVVELCYF